MMQLTERYLKVCVGISKICLDRYSQPYMGKIEEGKNRKFKALISVHVLAIPTQISNISPPVTSLICYP